jgi:toxin ParE1/3/4
MTEFYIHPEAEEELRKANIFYRIRSKHLSLRFLKEFERAKESIQSFPESSPVESEDVRKKVMGDSFPYNVLYFMNNNIIYILAVAHQSRHPDYWKSRLKDLP